MIQEDNALVEFIRDAVQNNFKSAQEGRPIFEDRDFVRIMTPGDTRTAIYREATAQDKARFAKAWGLYERGLEAVTEGTPLSEWNQITASQVRELQHVNVRTVEQFVGVSDANIQRMGPGYAQLQKRATQYLEASTDNAAAAAAARENEQLREKMALMQEQIDALVANAAVAVASTDSAAAAAVTEPQKVLEEGSGGAESSAEEKRATGRSRKATE